MSRRAWLRWLYYLDVLIVVAVVGYKVYLDVFDARLQSVHAVQVERIQERLAGRDSFQFAVVGNVNNSIGLFERQIIPMLEASGAEFLVSVGNAVSDGGEDKYRALRGTLSRLDIPYLLTFGENEASGLGGFRFYRHFGPYFFAFTAGDARLVFLDATGETSPEWQLRWLEELLATPGPDHTFLFLGRPVLRPAREPLLTESEDYLEPASFRRRLLDLIRIHPVDAVFAGNVPLFDLQVRDGTRFATTGGAGGLVVSDEDSFHHFVMVTVSGGPVAIEARRLDVGQHPFFRTLESLWLFVHSLFFVGYLNFLLILGLLVLVAVKLHALVFVDRDYYPRFDVDPAPFLEAPLRVAMFTNNFLPFIGGVPVSVERLRRGLLRLGEDVLVVAPDYGAEGDAEGAAEGNGEGDAEAGAEAGAEGEAGGREGGAEGGAAGDGEGSADGGIERVPSIPFGRDTGFRMANIFHPRLGRRVRAFSPDVVHVHHPFWLGSVGLRLARRMGVPAIYTYHTRFEHYAHYVPVPGRLFRNLISHVLIRRFANRCFGVVVPTPSAREYLRAIGVKSRVMVRPTGIEYEAFQSVDPAAVKDLRRRLGLGDELVLVSVARLSEEKNIGFMLEAVDALRRRLDVPFRLLLVGEGDDREELEERVTALGLDDIVLMPGAVPSHRMPLYYHLGDVFVFASVTETQGMVVLEAMAAGLPVVAVRSSGIDDLVRDGHNGYKTVEHVGPWAARVEALLIDDGLRAEVSRRARSFARDYDIEPFAREVLTFYAEALARQRDES